MQIQHMPKVNARYWSAITLASLFGTNLGDLYAHELGLGIVRGIALLAVLAAGVFMVERRDDAPRELFYWLVIIIIRTGATNIADYFKHQITWPAFSAILAVLMAGTAWASTRRKDKAEREAEANGMPKTGSIYWTAMLTAGVFGTFFGDVASKLVGKGYASIGLGLLLICTLALWRRHGVNRLWLYWLAVATARTAGTAMGDWLAETKALGIGLPLSTLITGTVFILILVLWPRRGGRAVPVNATA
jgi:uncharacterized membrane-anchored protein